ncbi:MAG: hypothetical protein AAF191_15495, partial [Verrucomicrobiota bacterium]
MKLRLFLISLLLQGFVSAQETPRSWTSSDGKSLTGTLEGVAGEEVQLRTSRGVFRVPLTRLSQEDQDYVASWQKNAPLEIAPWPDQVEVKDLEIAEFSDGEEFVYHSPHFEFRLQAQDRLETSVVKEFARIFEATYEGVAALPVGFEPMPAGDNRFLTILHPSMSAYIAAGGVPGSGGMYSWRSRNGEFVSGQVSVPLTSLGVKQVGSRYIIDHDRDSGTLVHEIT